MLEHYNNLEESCNIPTCHRLTKGEITSFTLDGGSFLIPGTDINLVAGDEQATFKSWTLERAAVLTKRICPFATFWFAPGFSRPDARRKDLLWGGFAIPSHGLSVINSGRHARLLLPSICHEAFHLWEPFLPKDRLADLDADALVSPYSEAWPGEYSASLKERSARRFQAYAAMRFEGEKGNPGLMEDLFSGNLSGSCDPVLYYKSMYSLYNSKKETK